MIGKQNSNFLPLWKKFKIQKILEEQTNRISTKLNHLQIQLTDIHHLGCPKIRFFAKITKTYRFSMNWSSPIYPILSHVTKGTFSTALLVLLCILRENCPNLISRRFFFSGARVFLKCKWQLFNEQNRNLFTNRNSVSFDSSSYES